MMTSKAPMTPTPPPAPVDQPKDATAELAYYADKYRNTPITEQFNLLLIYTQNLAANTGDALLTTSEIAWLRRSVEHHLEDSMTTQPTDPRPAATEAAMIQDVQATLDDMEAHDVALTAGNLIDALDYHGIRLAAAPPSGQVDCDAVATVLDGYFPPDIVAHIITEALAAAPLSGRAACSTCGETGVDHDGFACRDCDGQGSTPIAAPPSGQGVTAEDWRALRRVVDVSPHQWRDRARKIIDAALADAGTEATRVTLNTRRVFDMAVALTDAHIRVEAVGDQRTLEPCTCPDCLFALEFIEAHDAALADAGTDSGTGVE